jgi:hypothetical protein
MLIRVLALSVVAMALLFSAVIFDAASSARAAADLIASARTTQSSHAQRMMLARIDPMLRSSWSKPLSWHAGAAELQSGAFALLAASPDDQRLRQSADAAVASLKLAPIQPLAWLRLATLAHYGQPNPLCAARECLARSWATGPLLEADDACLRLGVAVAEGEHIARADPRIDNFIVATPSAEKIAQCLSFLPPEDQFALMLTARENAISQREAYIAAIKRR